MSVPRHHTTPAYRKCQSIAVCILNSNTRYSWAGSLNWLFKLFWGYLIWNQTQHVFGPTNKKKYSSPCPCHKVIQGVDTYLYSVLTSALDAGGWSTPASFPSPQQKKKAQCSLNRRLDGPQSQSECFAEGKNTFPRLDSNPWSSSP